jgi:hypothetical protein
VEEKGEGAMDGEEDERGNTCYGGLREKVGDGDQKKAK